MKPCAPRRTYIPALAPTTCLEVYYSDCRWPDWTPCEDPGWNPQYRVTQDWAWRERALRAAATRTCTDPRDAYYDVFVCCPWDAGGNTRVGCVP